MSAPTPAPGDDRPREGYYPDPSIPGYVRYWNGAAWVPGTSRPAPSDGDPLAPPPGSAPNPSQAPASPVEETGPHFFDEDPQPSPSDAQHGSHPEPAPAWGADRSHQSGFGDDQARRVSWGADPRVGQPTGDATSTDGTATIPPANGGAADVPSDGTFVFRRPAGGGGGGAATPGTPSAGVPQPGRPVADEGTMTFRALSPRTGQQGGAQGGGTGAPGPGTSGGPAFGPPSSAAAADGPGFAAGKTAAQRAAAQAAPAAPTALTGRQQPAPALPQQAGTPQQAPVGAPMTSGPGGGQPSWAQQVHRLAGAPDEEQPVAPWKPPVEDVFQAAARRQAAARPAGLGKRLIARIVDNLVIGAVTAVAAVPLGGKAVDHIHDKIDAARLSGETVTVWLLDGTTSVYLGIVLAVLLVFGVLYEALPTARWGRTLGKKLLALEVRDIEAHEPPSFGAAVRRWLVYSVPGLLGIGIVGVLWCLFDRPWHQCWHDKAAGTFVAG